MVVHPRQLQRGSATATCRSLHCGQPCRDHHHFDDHDDDHDDHLYFDIHQMRMINRLIENDDNITIIIGHCTADNLVVIIIILIMMMMIIIIIFMRMIIIILMTMMTIRLIHRLIENDDDDNNYNHNWSSVMMIYDDNDNLDNLKSRSRDTVS